MAERSQDWFASAAGSSFYAREGAGERAAPVLLLHGLCETSRVFDPLVARLGATRRLILPDLAGHGRSDYPLTPEAVGLDVLATDLERLIEREELCRVVLLGHDLGGVLALHLAQANPLRIAALVLVEAGAPLSATGLLERCDLLQQAAATRDWARAAKTLDANATNDSLARRLLGMHAGRPALDADIVSARHLAGELTHAGDAPSALAAVIAKPVLVIAPQRSRILNSDALANLAWKKPDLKRSVIDASTVDFLADTKALGAIEMFLKSCP